MSHAINLPGVKRIVSNTPSDTSETTMLTAGEERPVVAEIWITNLTASNADATLKWGDGSTDFSLIDTEQVDGRSRIGPIECTIPLRKDYTIKITSGTGGALTFSIVVVETVGILGSEHAHG